MARFIEERPATESSWRAIILFGRNVASYKFALAQSLLRLAGDDTTFVRLEDLAVPYAQHIATHLKSADKQATSTSSRFLDACRQFNQGTLPLDRLVETTVLLGFNNVLDAFHVVNQGEIPTRFFVDQRAGRTKGIALTDDLLRLKETAQYQNLPHETEARWRLVETAWALNMSPRLLEVRHDAESEAFYVQVSHDLRIPITSCRDALNGYQKGKCFYCFADIAVDPCSATLADVDHFFPLALLYADPHALPDNRLNQIWNLVLACRDCNRGPNGKFARVPQPRYVERLHRRNSFLIESRHPLRETLLGQMGQTEAARAAFLREHYREAINRLIHQWGPEREGEPAF